MEVSPELGQLIGHICRLTRSLGHGCWSWSDPPLNGHRFVQTRGALGGSVSVGGPTIRAWR